MFINFFFALSKNINTAIFGFFFIYLIIAQRKFINKILIISIPVAIICSLLLIFQTTYRPDAGLYHLPYIGILNSEKIIIGLSNIHFRYGHTSIVQYLSAINNNWIFNNEGVTIPIAIIFSYFLLYLIHEIKSENNKIIVFFNFIIIAFLCLKINRYSDFGNDAPAHIFYFFLISISLKSTEIFNKKNMGKVIIVATYIVFNKITLFLGSIIPFIIMIYKKEFKLCNFKVLFFVTLFTVSFFTKNLLVSGCFAFPIEKTCLTNIFWYDDDSSRGSNAKITMSENEAWTKGYPDQKKNHVSYEKYLSNFGWIEIWYKNHGKRTLIKLIPFLSFLLIISVIVYRLGTKKNLNPNNLIDKKIFLVFMVINIFGSLMWFFKFPVFRYGSSYLILTIAFFMITVLWDKILSINITKLKKILSYCTILLLIIFISKNTHRVFKNYEQVYNQHPWPKIYAEDQDNMIKKNKPIYKNNQIIFYQSMSGLCYYNSPPCTHVLNSQFNIEEINFKKIFGYKVIYFD